MNSGLIKLQEFRNEAGRRLYYQGKVHRNGENKFIVYSESFDNEYEIEIVSGYTYCSCPDYEKRSKILTCKHIKSVELYIKNSMNLIIND